MAGSGVPAATEAASAGEAYRPIVSTTRKRALPLIIRS